MRLLALETSTTQGSVALMEGGVCIAARRHGQANAHAEQLLPLVDQAMAAAGWSRTSIDRVAVGVGPGSFTGLRVGIALAQGIALGLGIPIVGVSSLAAMARAAQGGEYRLLATLLDARRNEIFVAGFAPDGTETVAPRAVPRSGIAEHLRGLFMPQLGAGAPPERELLLLGAIVRELPELQDWRHWQSAETDGPDAIWVGTLGEQQEVSAHAVEPAYAREPDAAMPAVAPDDLARALGL